MSLGALALHPGSVYGSWGSLPFLGPVCLGLVFLWKPGPVLRPCLVGLGLGGLCGEGLYRPAAEGVDREPSDPVSRDVLAEVLDRLPEPEL
ncbi:hypothetical protein GDO86_000720 [Hymenochirus boettgeri]|uniref:Uncharacterized protein n=1 Tax=Hymenochirus boettgeri TaxID=247094 RepID=A0A8T2KE84_9PIPI|nr:hypothetical protein GDO86_000720 [Hymenochirus boettgeri]